jgi:hypothetical protein
MTCNKDYYNYFLGNKDNIKDLSVFNYFDVNYLPLENLPISYFSMSELGAIQANADDTNRNLAEIIKKIDETMELKDNNFNNYTIYPTTVILLIFLLFLLIFLLRLIQYNYPLYYNYILIGIIIILLLFTSLWFLYVNSSIL